MSSYSVTWKGNGSVALVYQDDAGEYETKAKAIARAMGTKWHGAWATADVVAVVESVNVVFLKGNLWELLDYVTEWRI